MDLPVVIGIDRAGLVGEDGETHHGIFDIGLLTPLPNMIIAQPKDASEARNLTVYRLPSEASVLRSASRKAPWLKNPDARGRQNGSASAPGQSTMTIRTTRYAF